MLSPDQLRMVGSNFNQEIYDATRARLEKEAQRRAKSPLDHDFEYHHNQVIINSLINDFLSARNLIKTQKSFLHESGYRNEILNKFQILDHFKIPITKEENIPALEIVVKNGLVNPKVPIIPVTPLGSIVSPIHHPELLKLSETEIEKIRLEGYSRARQEMIDYKKRLDDEHLQFVEKMKIQEENLTQAFKQQLLEKDQESNIVRQKSIQTIEEIRKREDLINQKSNEESEKMRIQMEQINKREYEISTKMKEIDDFLKEEKKKLKKYEEELVLKSEREINERIKSIEKEEEEIKSNFN